MRERLLQHLNRLRKYLDLPEYLPNEDGITAVFVEQSPFDCFQVKLGSDGATLHTWDISHHNGDPFNHEMRFLSEEETIKRLLDFKTYYEKRAAERAKHQIEQRAIKEELRRHDLLWDELRLFPTDYS